MHTLKQIKKLWLKCYGENLRTEYSGFYKILKKKNSITFLQFKSKSAYLELSLIAYLIMLKITKSIL